jgi:hypothetical protein
MRRLTLSLVTAALVAACDTGPATPAGSGPLTISVESPRGAEAAAVVRLVGPGLGSAAPIDSEVYSDRRGDTLRVIVLREEPGLLRFTVEVQDTTRKPLAELVEVAGADNLLQGAVQDYAVEVRR